MTGTEPGDNGGGVVRRRRRAQPVVHLPRGLRDRQPGPGRGGRGLHRRLPGPGARARTTSTTTSTRWTPTAIDADVYDVDAEGRTAPDALGVLSHYDAAIWYTGDDIVTRTAGRAPATPTGSPSTRCGVPRLHERGRQGACTPATRRASSTPAAVGTQIYDPKGEIACNPLPAGIDPRRCLPLRGSGDGVNDVLQYWFGGYLADPGRRTRRRRQRLRRGRHRRPVRRARLGDERPRVGRQPGLHVVVHLDQRHPARGRVLAVRELAVGAVGQARWPVRPAHR